MSSAKDLTATSFRLSDFIQTPPKGQVVQGHKTQLSENLVKNSEGENNIRWLLFWAY
jgi:hypothetical protein